MLLDGAGALVGIPEHVDATPPKLESCWASDNVARSVTALGRNPERTRASIPHAAQNENTGIFPVTRLCMITPFCLST